LRRREFIGHVGASAQQFCLSASNAKAGRKVLPKLRFEPLIYAW
jgi:hypothetical protein